MDDKNIDALLSDSEGEKIIETKIKVFISSGMKDSVISKVAFANIENYYDSVNTIELYMNKDTNFV